MGNPGPEYARTRHNIGFRVVERLAADSGASWSRLRGLDGLAATARVAGVPALLVRPLTYVNRCGPVLETLRQRHALGLEDLLVVVDDVALPVGRLRLRGRGSDGGHNGLRSLILHLGSEEFPRLRIGVGAPEGVALERFVLEPFPEEQRGPVEEAVHRAAASVGLWVAEGLERAMDRVNRADLDPPAAPA